MDAKLCGCALLDDNYPKQTNQQYENSCNDSDSLEQTQ